MIIRVIFFVLVATTAVFQALGQYKYGLRPTGLDAYLKAAKADGLAF